MGNRNLRSVVIREVEDSLSDVIWSIDKYVSIYEKSDCRLEIEYKLKKAAKRGDYKATYNVIVKIYPLYLTEKQSIDCNKIKYFEFELAKVCEDKSGNVIVKKKNNYTFWRLLKYGCYLLKKNDVNNYCRDNVFDLLYRLLYPKKSGCLRNLYRGKNIWWLHLLLKAMPIIITMLINLYLILKYPNAYYTYWLPR